jgi:hypothetical protein
MRCGRYPEECKSAAALHKKISAIHRAATVVFVGLLKDALKVMEISSTHSSLRFLISAGLT